MGILPRFGALWEGLYFLCILNLSALASFNLLHQLVFLPTVYGQKPNSNWLKQKWSLLIQEIKKSAARSSGNSQTPSLPLTFTFSVLVDLSDLPFLLRASKEAEAVLAYTLSCPRSGKDTCLSPCSLAEIAYFFLNGSGPITVARSSLNQM